MIPCSGCGVVRTALNTNRYKRSNDGLQKYCKACNSKACASWAQTHPARVAAHRNRRRAKLAQYPVTKQLVGIYWVRSWVQILTGIELHVDHVVPLAKGGIHYITNLEVVGADYNLAKGASLLPDQSLARAR